MAKQAYIPLHPTPLGIEVEEIEEEEEGLGLDELEMIVSILAMVIKNLHGRGNEYQSA
jgi:hypothetical protein